MNRVISKTEVPQKLYNPIGDLLAALLVKQGFSGPAGVRQAAELVYAMYKHELEPLERQGEIAHLIEVPDWGGRSKRVAAAWKNIWAQHLGVGTAYGILEEGCNPENFPYTEISPRPGARAYTNSSNDELAFHNELAGLPEAYRPQWLSLLCIKNDALTKTGLVSASAIDFGLSEVSRRALRAKRSKCKTPPSLAGVETESEPRAVIFDTPDGVGSVFRFDLTRPANDTDVEAELALIEAQQLANENAVWLCLQPGQLLFFDNVRAMHARTPIGEGERLLLRAYWRQDVLSMDMSAGTEFAHVISAKLALTSGSIQ